MFIFDVIKLFSNVVKKIFCTKSAEIWQFFNYADFLENGAPIENSLKKPLK